MIGKATSNAGAQYAAAPGRRKVALALQGGGSHGAFTWGVLDRLLDDETIEIIGVTGTSAGAMNGAVLVDGLVRGGLDGGEIDALVLRYRRWHAPPRRRRGRLAHDPD